MYTKAITNQENLAKALIRIMMGVLLLFACSQISIPLEPVPISLQTVGVLLIAILYDLRGGMAAVLSYIALGVAGVPIFASYHSGISVFLRPSGGYIIGFIACIYVVNMMKAMLNMEKTMSIFLSCLIGTGVIFVFGIAWLSYLIGFENAIIHGFIPFIVPGLIKAVVLTAFLRSLGALRIGRR